MHSTISFVPIAPPCSVRRVLRDKFEDLGLGLHEPHLAGDMALVELVAHPLRLDRFHNGGVAMDPDLLGSEDGLVEGINKSLPVDRDGALFLLSTIRGGVEVGSNDHGAERPSLIVAAKLADPAGTLVEHSTKLRAQFSALSSRARRVRRSRRPCRPSHQTNFAASATRMIAAMTSKANCTQRLLNRPPPPV